MSSLSLASRQVRPASRASCRNWWASHQLPRRRSHHFSRHRRIRLLGIRRRCPRCFGGGSRPPNPKPAPPTISASAVVNACWASSAATTQTGSFRLPVRSRRSFEDTRAYQMRSPVVVVNVPFCPPRHRAVLRAGLTGIGRPRNRGDRDLAILGGACAGERPANGQWHESCGAEEATSR